MPSVFILAHLIFNVKLHASPDGFIVPWVSAVQISTVGTVDRHLMDVINSKTNQSEGQLNQQM